MGMWTFHLQVVRFSALPKDRQFSIPLYFGGVGTGGTGGGGMYKLAHTPFLIHGQRVVVSTGDQHDLIINASTHIARMR